MFEIVQFIVYMDVQVLECVGCWIFVFFLGGVGNCDYFGEIGSLFEWLFLMVLYDGVGYLFGEVFFVIFFEDLGDFFFGGVGDEFCCVDVLVGIYVYVQWIIVEEVEVVFGIVELW